MQCTTRRVNSKRDLFETLTSINIARDHHNRIIHRLVELFIEIRMGSAYQSDSISNARVCAKEFVIEEYYIFLIIANIGFCFW